MRRILTCRGRRRSWGRHSFLATVPACVARGTAAGHVVESYVIFTCTIIEAGQVTTDITVVKSPSLVTVAEIAFKCTFTMMTRVATTAICDMLSGCWRTAGLDWLKSRTIWCIVTGVNFTDHVTILVEVTSLPYRTVQVTYALFTPSSGPARLTLTPERVVLKKITTVAMVADKWKDSVTLDAFQDPRWRGTVPRSSIWDGTVDVTCDENSHYQKQRTRSERGHGSL